MFNAKELIQEKANLLYTEHFINRIMGNQKTI